MAPSLPATVSALYPRNAFPGLAKQLASPIDIFSILLIVGGDIIQRALAQVVGSRARVAPVAFSFGWVAYAVSSVVAAIGEGKLMPQPDYQCIVINGRSGYARKNDSWVLGRVMRDWEIKREWVGYSMVATVVRVSKTKEAGVPELDVVWWIGVVVIAIQMVIAAMPAILYKSWSCLTITFCGTMLSLAHGCLPQWRQEKWTARHLDQQLTNQRTGSNPGTREKAFIMTQGNGSSHVLVIISEGIGLDLEDLASSRVTRNATTVPAVLLLMASWTVLLLVAAGSTDHGWFLLAVGSLGMCQNILTAGVKRAPSALGIHFDHVVDIMSDKNGESNKVFAVLRKLEEYHNPSQGLDRRRPSGLDFVGLSLLPIFFPGELRPEESEWKEARIKFYKQRSRLKEQPTDLNLSGDGNANRSENENAISTQGDAIRSRVG